MIAYRFNTRLRMKISCSILGLMLLALAGLTGCATTSPSQPAGSAPQELNAEALRQYSGGDYEKAVRIWQAALEKEPDSPKLLFNLGLGYFATKQFDKSLVAFSRALERQQDFTPALINRALTLSQLGDYAEASRDLKKAAQIDPGNILVTFNRGVLAALQGQYAQAIEHYTSALEMQSQLAPALNNRGICRLEIGEPLQATSDFTKAIQIQGKKASYYFNRAIAWEERSRFDKAVTDYTKAVALEPELAPAYSNRGLLRINLNRMKEGCRDLEQACNLGMCEQFRNLQNRGVCPGHEAPGKQNGPAKDVLHQTRPQAAHLDVEPLLPGQGDPSQGTVQDMTLEGGASGDQSTPSDKVRGLVQDSPPDEARPHQSMASQPTKPKPESDLSAQPSESVLPDQKGHEPAKPREALHFRASRELDSVAERMKQDPEAIYQSALDILLKEQKYGLARERLEEFITYFSKSPLLPNAYYWLGETYYVQNDFRRSIHIFEIGFNRFPDHSKAPAFLLKTGLAFMNLNKSAQAKDRFERLVAEYPSTASATLAREKLATLR